MVKILQTNLQRKARAHDMAVTAAKRHRVDILVASEPNRTKIKDTRWIKDPEESVAILFLNRKVKAAGSQLAPCIISVMLEEFRLTCCYLLPNAPLESYRRLLEIINQVTSEGEESVVMGDMNAKSARWGSPTGDIRGEELVEWLDSRDLVVLNRGSNPTWSRGDQKSYIDVTMATRVTARKTKKWEVLEDESLSDHAFILLQVGETVKHGSDERKKRVMDSDKIKDLAELRMSNVRPTVAEITKTLQDIQNEATVKRNGRPVMVPYWWSAAIEEARVDCIAKRRRLTRRRRRGGVPEVTELQIAYKEARRELGKRIKGEKKKCWNETLEALDSDIWGQGYAIVKKAMLKTESPYDMTKEQKMNIARHLFPADEGEMEPVRAETHWDVSFSEEEVRQSDEITAEVVKEAVLQNTGAFREMYSNLAQKGEFPDGWKVSRLVLLWKGKAPAEAPTSQRPICLINVLGKLFEAIIKKRLTEEVDEGRGLAESQYGFRKGRSTIQAVEQVQRLVDAARTERYVALVTIDIRNAFNTARWNLIMRELENREIGRYLLALLRNYLSGRSVDVEGERMEVNLGVPQGSVIGPRLWNITKPQRSNKPCPIYVNFASIHVKKKFYNNKKSLKGTGIVMREDLTIEKLQILKAVIEKVRENGQVWSNNGHIFVKLKNKRDIIKVDSQHDVTKL